MDESVRVLGGGCEGVGMGVGVRGEGMRSWEIVMRCDTIRYWCGAMVRCDVVHCDALWSVVMRFVVCVM